MSDRNSAALPLRGCPAQPVGGSPVKLSCLWETMIDPPWSRLRDMVIGPRLQETMIGPPWLSQSLETVIGPPCSRQSLKTVIMVDQSPTVEGDGEQSEESDGDLSTIDTSESEEGDEDLSTMDTSESEGGDGDRSSIMWSKFIVWSESSYLLSSLSFAFFLFSLFFFSFDLWSGAEQLWIEWG